MKINIFYLTQISKKKKSYDYNLNNSIISPSKKYEEFFSAYWRTYSISNYINENKIDIFHGLSNEIPRSIKKTRAKSVLTIHDLIFIRFPELYKPLDRIIYRKKAEAFELIEIKADRMPIGIHHKDNIDFKNKRRILLSYIDHY